uniref:Pentatricopeptide repeat-containing protein n=1 Tax=Pristionchus pacificus TaxID=54126 RepID=A0A8R1V5V2_PRIPA
MIRPRLLALRSSKVMRRSNQSTEAPHSFNEIRQMIPTAVKRSPSDLLSALSSTVGKDTTAPHFQFIDDPSMIPSTLVTRKSYYMAKEMGKRAARQLATEWPTLFAFDRDEPRLEVFRPQGNPDPLQMEPTEESLVSLIESRCVKDACMLYERMRSDGVDISDHAKDSLFALTSFYNNEDVPLSEVEEWHGLRNIALIEKTPWTTAGVADLVYESLPPSSLRKSILISALCKHSSPSSIKRARELYEELKKEDKSSIPSRTYAAIISTSTWRNAIEILSTMKDAGVRPEESVWNALMQSASKIPVYKDRMNALRSTMGEMITCGEKGSLSVFNSLLTGLEDDKEGDKEADKEKKIVNSISVLVEILNELEKIESIEIVTSNDSNFFCSAMYIARKAGNLPLARRIVSLYESKKNTVKLMSLSNEGAFYSSFLLLCSIQVQSIDEFYKMYIYHVPRVVGVSKGLCQTVFTRLEATPHWPLLHRLIDDCISSRLITDIYISNSIRIALINTPLQSLSPSERDDYSSLIPRLVSIWIEFSRFTGHMQRLQTKLSPFSISECSLLLMRVGEREKAWHLLEMLCEEGNTHGEDATISAQGTVKAASMNELLDDAIRRGHAENAATCIQLISSTDVNKQRLEQMTNTVISRCGLTTVQARIVSTFVRLREE